MKKQNKTVIDIKKHKKRFPLEVVIAIIVIVAYAWVVIAPSNSFVNWFNTDDAYYYFKVAQNIASGHGVTFDGINPTNGFHPLWMIVCIPVFLIANTSRILALRILAFVLIILNAGTSILLFRLLKKFITIQAAFVGALFWALFPAINIVTTQGGLEAGLSAFFIILFISMAVSYRQKETDRIKYWQMACFGLAGAAVILSRLDNIFLVAAVALWLVFRGFKLRKEVIVDGIVSGIIMLFSYVIRIGSDGNYVAYSKVIYFSILASVIIKPLMIHWFKTDRAIEMGNIRESVWRFFTPLFISSLLIIGILFVVSKLDNHFLFSKTILLFDFLISIIVLGILRIIRWKKNRQFDFSFTQWIKTRWKPLLIKSCIVIAPLVLFVGGYILWNYVNFHTFTPVSGQIKQWWATIPNTVYGHKVDAITFLGFSTRADYGPWSIGMSIPAAITAWMGNITGLVFSQISLYVFLFFLAVIISLFWLLSRLKKGFITTAGNKIGLGALLIGCLLQISFYNFTSYPNTRMWYWVGELLFISILLSLSLGILFELFEQKKAPVWLKNAIFIFLCVAIFLTFSFSLFKIIPININQNKTNPIFSEVQTLEKFTDYGSRIGMPGGGNIAYFISGRTIINLDGLINSPEYFGLLKSGFANDFIKKMDINYIYGNEYMIKESDPYSLIFSNRIEQIIKIPDTDNFVLYRYNPNGNR